MNGPYLDEGRGEMSIDTLGSGPNGDGVRNGSQAGYGDQASEMMVLLFPPEPIKPRVI